MLKRFIRLFRRASEIIEDLLCFARPRTESDRAPVRLIPIVREALRIALNNRREYEIELSLSDCADEEVVVTGSAGSLAAGLQQPLRQCIQRNAQRRTVNDFRREERRGIRR